MHRIAFKMKLFPGCATEYKRRHDELWPDLLKLLKKAGVRDYSIYLDEETGYLFATLKVGNTHIFDMLPSLTEMQNWWAYMADIMETNTDNSPVAVPLTEMFYLG